MNPVVEKIIKSFSDETKMILRDNLVAEYLFGSLARNEAEKDSDIDILIIVKQFDYQLRKELSKLSSNYSLKHGVCISPVIKDLKIWQQNEFYQTLFYQEIQRDSVRLC
ncbi:MAG: nucleotidyltransferase domain-containing protein [candidate division KSB1 bacterium]|nr:nucleotidyltransferase domain-containing protein [candidate division KSB1 bacterium]MDZ7364485.1 nucleotidyltransferase domain-containing protein [candidate division KSB1 bacterium]MDZ7402857.1 nucleotidyltransferase domain-containing protein [candidate division KSB1 bacterium]